jgi:hypothetical protein
MVRYEPYLPSKDLVDTKSSCLIVEIHGSRMEEEITEVDDDDSR